MILFGCLLAFGAAVAPRIVLILAWIFSDRWHAVWQGQWIWPLLGIIFLPYTTIMYLLTWSLLGGIEGWDWMWILIGLFLDFMKWSQMFANRKEAAAQTSKYYPSGAPDDGSAATATIASAAAVPSEPAVPAVPAEPAEPPAPAASPEPAVPATPAGEDASPLAPVDRELAQLEDLHASGALTDDEYEAAKAKLKA